MFDDVRRHDAGIEQLLKASDICIALFFRLKRQGSGFGRSFERRMMYSHVPEGRNRLVAMGCRGLAYTAKEPT
ncbi:hypothetical protein WI67_05575 [Burkholderia cepacia]|nr:hypothetical protein WI67_05575 [Burkholderia cepacia]